MLGDWKFWVLTAAALLVCGLVFANISRYTDNLTQQADVASRQKYINEAIQLSRFNTQFIQMLANLAAQTNDESLHQLLSKHGITYSVAPNQPPPPPATAQPDKAARKP